MNTNLLHRSTKIVLYLVHFVLFFLLAIFVFYSRIYPYSDDWTYISPLEMESTKEFVSWVFVQHVDHRIPIQKVFHYLLAQFSGYDFRVLVFSNIIIALATSLILISIAKIYRGYHHWGDTIIPLIILSPVAGYSLWAFQFQFLSSIFFVSAAILFLCKYADTQQRHYLFLAFLQLFFCSFCGMNGVIFSTTLTIGLIFFLCKKNKLLFLLSAGVLVENALLWFLWTPSSASEGILSFQTIAEIFLKLLPSSMIVFMFNDSELKIGIIVILLTAVIYGFFKKWKGKELSFIDILLGLSLLASFAIVLSIATGRSKVQDGWNNVLAMHYGYLTVLLPIIAWICISKFFNARISLLVGIIGITIFGAAYKKNYSWRDEYVRSVFEKQNDIYSELKKNTNTKALVDKYALDLNWKDDEASKKGVVHGLSILRKHKIPIYTATIQIPYTLNPVVDQDMDNFSSSAVEANQRINDTNWIQSGDFNRTVLNNFLILGSYISSDTDIGKLELNIRRGQNFFYRSGPHAEHQLLEITDHNQTISFPLPIANGWVQLKFNGDNLSDSFIVTIRDDGTTWGEWSAIALQKVGASNK